jgi:hypothetical protein
MASFSTVDGGLQFACAAPSDWTVASLARAGPQEIQALGRALAEHSLVAIGGGEEDEQATPAELCDAYLNGLKAMGLESTGQTQLGLEAVSSRPPTGDLLRGAYPEGHPETVVMGFGDEIDWHGLQGRLLPSSWYGAWCMQYHHDGGYTAGGPAPPALVGFYCDETPSHGGGTFRYADGSTLDFTPGSTVFYSTRNAMRLASPALAARARHMVAVYGRGLSQLMIPDVYPILKPPDGKHVAPGLVPVLPPPASGGSGIGTEDYEARIATWTSEAGYDQYIDMLAAAEAVAEAGGEQMESRGQPVDEDRIALVQKDDDTGEEYVHIHIISHEYLEEEVDGVRRRLPYAEAKAFLEELLGPPSAP